MSLTQVMLVDDHAVVRMGFRALLETTSDIRVCAEASSGKEACKLYAELLPDVVVMDVSMPDIDGIGATERIVAKNPRARILMLSAHEACITPKCALQAGAMGYLSKRSAAEELIKAIRQVAQGGNYVDPLTAQAMVLQGINGGDDPLKSLSSREFEVFRQLAIGKSVAAIAKVLCLSPSTVGTHLYNIKQKLGASNGAELAILAVRHGIVDVPTFRLA